MVMIERPYDAGTLMVFGDLAADAVTAGDLDAAEGRDLLGGSANRSMRSTLFTGPTSQRSDRISHRPIGEPSPVLSAESTTTSTRLESSSTAWE